MDDQIGQNIIKSLLLISRRLEELSTTIKESNSILEVIANHYQEETN
jgi:hypothetical protein